MNTPTPRTIAFCNSIHSNVIEATEGGQKLRDFAMQLERELDEARRPRPNNQLIIVERERDQLRKVADELAEAIECELSFNAVEQYNQLPHVIERNKSK